MLEELIHRTTKFEKSSYYIALLIFDSSNINIGLFTVLEFTLWAAPSQEVKGGYVILCSFSM